MTLRRYRRVWYKLHKAASRRGFRCLHQRVHVVPLATLAARLEHGELGVWDEVGVGALLVGCAVAYGVWFFLSGRGEKPNDSE